MLQFKMEVFNGPASLKDMRTCENIWGICGDTSQTSGNDIGGPCLNIK